MNISYGISEDAWGEFKNKVEELAQRFCCKAICEVGGGANPLLEAHKMKAKGIDYAVLDISAAELEKAPEGYRKLQADICAPVFPESQEFDFVFSKMLAEHVRDGKVFHANVRKLLRPGGIAFHFFPTLFALPFVVNKLLPESITDRIIYRLQPTRDRFMHGKFRAYYSWCRGPTSSQIRRLEELGLEVIEYQGFFGHDGYYRRFPPLQVASRSLANLLNKHPNPYLTSFAYLLVKRK